ncbi:MAG: hypothetical protein ACRD1R_17100 [Acidobacteriota bacterium]
MQEEVKTGPGEVSSEELRRQAERLRVLTAEARTRPYSIDVPLWKKILLLILTVGTLAGAVYLLLAQEQRRELIAYLGGEWAGLYPRVDGDQVFELPPPPPKPVEPRVEYIGSPFAISAGSNQPPTILYSQTTPEAGSGAEASKGEDETSIEAPPEKTEAGIVAYNRLVQESPTVEKLVAGGYSEYQFQEWRPVKNDPPNFWIDFVATHNGQDVHLIWSINLESGAVAPLSQAARDLK